MLRTPVERLHMGRDPLARGVSIVTTDPELLPLSAMALGNRDRAVAGRALLTFHGGVRSALH
jgi:hypothetical protein